MIGFVLLLFPFVLLGFALLMGRVEEPLSQIATERQLERFLDNATQGELDTFVREGTDSALRRFGNRLRPTRFRARRVRREQRRTTPERQQNAAPTGSGSPQSGH